MSTDPETALAPQERDPDKRATVSYYGTLNLERIDLYPYTSFDGDVGFAVHRNNQVIGVHLTPECAEAFAHGILSVVEHQKKWDETVHRGWAGWRFRRGR